MGITSRFQSHGGSDITKDNNAATTNHTENVPAKPVFTGGKDGDVAQALFSSPEELHEEVDPAEARRVLWKIDLMILPYLAVCYAFFYIDKTTLSYAAIFGINEDLNLHGTQYSWLSSIFYFGFLAWAFVCARRYRNDQILTLDTDPGSLLISCCNGFQLESISASISSCGAFFS
jgi:hypothetical protein